MVGPAWPPLARRRPSTSANDLLEFLLLGDFVLISRRKLLLRGAAPSCSNNPQQQQLYQSQVFPSSNSTRLVVSQRSRLCLARGWRAGTTPVSRRALSRRRTRPVMLFSRRSRNARGSFPLSFLERAPSQAPRQAPPCRRWRWHLLREVRQGTPPARRLLGLGGRRRAGGARRRGPVLLCAVDPPRPGVPPL